MKPSCCEKANLKFNFCLFINQSINYDDRIKKKGVESLQNNNNEITPISFIYLQIKHSSEHLYYFEKWGILILKILILIKYSENNFFNSIEFQSNQFIIYLNLENKILVFCIFLKFV